MAPIHVEQYEDLWEEDDPPCNCGDCPECETRELSEFADPGGKSALRAGPRNFPCPTCDRPNRLSAKDVELGYQCDTCADQDEGGP